MLTTTVVTAIVRHLLTGVAGAFTVKYGIDGSTMDAIIGGLTALSGVAWSIYDKRAR